MFGVDKVIISVRQNETSVFLFGGHLRSNYKVAELIHNILSGEGGSRGCRALFSVTPCQVKTAVSHAYYVLL